MKKFPFTLPEWGFIILVMVLPLVVAFVWQSGNFLGFIAKAGGGMVLGFGVWLGLIFWPVATTIEGREMKTPKPNNSTPPDSGQLRSLTSMETLPAARRR